MAQRPLDLSLISADGLEDVSTFGKMHTYAVAWIDPYFRLSTPVDKAGGTKPVWNHKLSFPVPEFFFHQRDARLTVEIYSHGTFGNKFVGAAFIPLADLMKSQTEQILNYQVKRRSGRVKGSLLLSARLGETTGASSSSADVPVVAYPAGGYGNPQQGPPNYGGQGFPPYPSYPPQGYPPQQYYPPVQQAVPLRRPGMGRMGLGTGLLAGALGGFLLGDMIGDMSGGGYDGGGFDGGFDGGGFGF